MMFENLDTSLAMTVFINNNTAIIPCYKHKIYVLNLSNVTCDIIDKQYVNVRKSKDFVYALEKNAIVILNKDFEEKELLRVNFSSLSDYISDKTIEYDIYLGEICNEGSLFDLKNYISYLCKK